MGNKCKWLINVVTPNKPKMLRGLNQKGTWLVVWVLTSQHADRQPPADRPAPNPSIGQLAERGKPVILP
jgi:hypothetical protein